MKLLIQILASVILLKYKLSIIMS